MKLSRCLHDLGICDASPFRECDDLDAEFRVVKKLYHAKILKDHPVSAPVEQSRSPSLVFFFIARSDRSRSLPAHPPRVRRQDKGGDPATFRATRAAWQVVRDVHDQGNLKDGTFLSYLGGGGGSNGADDADDSGSDSDYVDDDLADLYAKYSRNTSVPSYDFFAAEAEEDVPAYCVEPAKSGRSTCVKSGTKIEKGALRVGSLDKMAGTYGRWAKLDFWRVPGKVQ